MGFLKNLQLFNNTVGILRIIFRNPCFNTGGIKVQAEQIEEILRPWMRVPFAITSVPDARLGEAVVLLVEKGADAELPETKMKELLSKYQLPKMILSVGAIPLTETGKINRAACRQLALTYRTDC